MHVYARTHATTLTSRAWTEEPCRTLVVRWRCLSLLPRIVENLGLVYNQLKDTLRKKSINLPMHFAFLFLALYTFVLYIGNSYFQRVAHCVRSTRFLHLAGCTYIWISLMIPLVWTLNLIFINSLNRNVLDANLSQTPYVLRQPCVELRPQLTRNRCW